MIRLRGISKTYQGQTDQAVAEVDLDVPEGTTLALIGPSGCGKSTILRMVNRLIEPDQGTVEVGGVDVRSVKPEELRRGIGYAIQGVGLFPHWTVAQNIGTVPRLMGWEEERIAHRVGELLDLVGLGTERYAGSYPDDLSGGEAQRVGVARALAADPPVLLMDEPFGAVDPLTRERLQFEFAGIQGRLRKTVLFVTHDLDEAVRLGDHIAVMNHGRVVQVDIPERVLAYPADGFVRDFVGAERALKRLSLVPLASVMGPPISFSAGVATSVPEDATLREALARLLEAGEDELPVSDGSGRVTGSVSLEGIMDHFRKPVER